VYSASWRIVGRCRPREDTGASVLRGPARRWQEGAGQRTLEPVHWTDSL